MERAYTTLDLGNSGLKLRRWRVASGARPEALEPRGARLLASAARNAASGTELACCVLAELERAPLAAGELVALCSVAAEAVERALIEALARALGDAFVARPEPGVDVDVEEPERVGRDRLFAARGAFELFRASALVIDAGTCVTVDALRARASGARGECLRPVFLGGAIAPGPALLADALARGGARLFAVEPEVGAPALGRDTRSALQSGVVVGLRGAVRELATEIARSTGLEGAPIAWTGGARRFLCEPLLFPECLNRIEPDLVHVGLLGALGVEWPASA